MTKLPQFILPALLVCGLGVSGYFASTALRSAMQIQPPQVELGDHSAVVQRYGARTVLFTSSTCTYCASMKQMLDERSVVYREIQVDKRPEDMTYLVNTLKVQSVPTLVRDDRRLTGFNRSQVERFLTP